MSGLYIGLAVVPGISNYLFTHYSYQEAFVLLIPMLTIHLLSGIVFTSFSDENDGLTEIVHTKNKSVETSHTKNKSVETSVKKVVGDVKVSCKIIRNLLSYRINLYKLVLSTSNISGMPKIYTSA